MFTVVVILILLPLLLIGKYCYLLGIGIYTAVLYAFDKYAARRNMRRVPEVQLLLAALAGGAVFALFTMFMVRHKTRKMSVFVPVFLLALIQTAAVFWLIK